MALCLLSSTSFAGVIDITSSWKNVSGKPGYFNPMNVHFTLHKDNHDYQIVETLYTDPINPSIIQRVGNGVTINAVTLPSADGARKQIFLNDCSYMFKPGEMENKIVLTISGSVGFLHDTRTVTCQKLD